ncbi:MAG: hypothetical protein LBG80_11130 [Bacteroidales bacterium]|jgi:hypothetical protein|nr:hypothetical protein [Bacteroidales bacterium]
MKRIVCIIIYCLLVLSVVQAKQLPDFVQQRLDSIKRETARSLRDYRVWNVDIDGRETLPRRLGFFPSGYILSYEETYLIDSLGLNISVGMIYDDEMRDRILQLMRNEYREDELDTLINRYMGYNLSSYEYDAMEMCGFDTMEVFRNTLDSLYLDIKSKEGTPYSKSMYKDKVFKLLQLDTTNIYKRIRNQVVEREREREKQELLNDTNDINTYLAELCGYIGDKRFIKPLIEILNKAEEDYQKEKIIEALARMRVEPYYTDYVKHRTLTPEQIRDEKWLDFKLEDFVYVLGTQEAYLELSKYLLSNKPNTIVIEDAEDHPESTIYPVSDEAFYLVRANVKNNDLQEIMKGEDSVSDPKVLRQTYDWMQKNYGKYKIKRIW